MTETTNISGYRLKRYLRPGALPYTFCPGCGCGTVLNVFCAAVDSLGINPENICMVSGIGCSSWIPSPYFMADTLHTTHGRALAFATGVKIIKPKMHVVVISGDGDIAGIGGNHLIHAARRNIGITVIMVNNQIYGMTGGQVAPTTPRAMKTVTTPYGNPEVPFRISELVAEAGAAFVARWTTGHPFQMKKAFEKALLHNVFSFVEVISQCPEYFGRKAGFKSPADLVKSIKARAIHSSETHAGSDKSSAKFCYPESDGFRVGTLKEQTDRTEFSESIRRTLETNNRNITERRKTDLPSVAAKNGIARRDMKA